VGLIPPHLLEQIRAANDIVDVVGASVPLKRAGSNFRGLCPFHREKTPSFNVNPANQIFKCFGCGKGGDVFSFVREYEGLDFMAAVRRLAERANIPLEFDENPAAQQQKHIKEVLWNIHEQITQRWQNALANEAGGQIARDYLAKRGVTAEAIKLFRLGAAPESWDDTVNWAKSKGHDLAVMEQTGLVVRKEGSDRPYDRFRGRLIFPICDEQGRVIAFSGRILSGDEKQAKYVNSPETPIFTKGKVFFGIDKSKRPMLDAESAIICEGQLDLMACYMAGVQNVVAPQGTALTPDHARILKRYVEEVVLCFDADNAGQNAATRSLAPLLEAGLAIRVATIPNGKDPDDFIKQHGGEAFREIIEHAEGFFDWFLKRLCITNDPRSDKGRVAVLREFGEALIKTRNAVLIDTHAQKAALRLGVSVDSVRAEFRKTKPAPQPRSERDEDFDRMAEEAEASAAATEANEVPSAPPTVRELQLLKLLLAHGDHRAVAATHLDFNWLTNTAVQRIAQRCLKDIEEGLPGGAALLHEFQFDPAAQALVSTVLTDHQVIPEPAKQIVDVLTNLRNDYLAAALQRLSREVAHPDLSDAERTELLHRQKELRVQKQRPLL
jgi:DNA primase